MATKLREKVDNNLENVLKMQAYVIQRQKTMIQEQEQILADLDKEHKAKMQEYDKVHELFVSDPHKHQEKYEEVKASKRDLLERMHLTEEVIAELKKNLAEANELEA